MKTVSILEREYVVSDKDMWIDCAKCGQEVPASYVEEHKAECSDDEQYERKDNSNE